ncbi:hypothetical protein VPHK460_0075 [Vibrio phage K460]
MIPYLRDVEILLQIYLINIKLPLPISIIAIYTKYVFTFIYQIISSNQN